MVLVWPRGLLHFWTFCWKHKLEFSSLVLFGQFFGSADLRFPIVQMIQLEAHEAFQCLSFTKASTLILTIAQHAQESPALSRSHQVLARHLRILIHPMSLGSNSAQTFKPYCLSPAPPGLASAHKITVGRVRILFLVRVSFKTLNPSLALLST